MPVLPSLLGDKVGLFDHDRFRGYDLPFASLLRPADSLSTLHPRGYPRWVQDSVLTGGLDLSEVAFSFHWIPPCLLGATPSEPAVQVSLPRALQELAFRLRPYGRACHLIPVRRLPPKVRMDFTTLVRLLGYRARQLSGSLRHVASFPSLRLLWSLRRSRASWADCSPPLVGLPRSRG